MAKLTRAQKRDIESALHHVRRALNFVRRPDTVVAIQCRQATTTLHYTRPDGAVLYSIDKEIGSDLTGMEFAEKELLNMLERNAA